MKKRAKHKSKMAEDHNNVLSRFAKLPIKNQATLLFVGVKGIGKHRLAKSMVGIHTDFSLQIRVATSLPLSTDADDTRPRIDFIVFFIDLTNRHSFEVIRSSINHVDTDYFLGHCCFVVTQAKNEPMHGVSRQEVTGLCDSYDSPLICADLEREDDRIFLSRKLLHQLWVSCGFCTDVTPLLLETTRRSFVFEDELFNDTIEMEL